MGGVEQASVAGLGEAFARIVAAPAGVVDAVDQPQAAPGLDGDERGQRDAPVGPAGHFHYRGVAAPSPGTPFGRPYALAGFVLEDQPGAQVRRRPFITGQVASFQAAICSSSRSVAWRAGTCTLHPIRCSSRSSPARVYSTLNSRQATSAMRASVQHWSSSHPQAPGPFPAQPPAPQPAPRSACTGHHQALSTSAPPGRLRTARAATGSPTSASPGSVSQPPGRWPRPRSGQPPLTAPARGAPAQPRSAHRHRDTS